MADAPPHFLALGSSGIPSSCLPAPSDSRVLSPSERKVQVPASRVPGGAPVSYSQIGGGLGSSPSSILGRAKPQSSPLNTAAILGWHPVELTGLRSKRPSEEITEQPPSKWQKLRENQRAVGSEQNPAPMPDSHERPISVAISKQQPPTVQKALQKPVIPPPNPSSSSSSAVFNQSPAAKAVRIPGWVKSDGSAAMGPPTGPKSAKRR